MVLSTRTQLMPSASQKASSADPNAFSQLDPTLPSEPARSIAFTSSDPTKNGQPTSAPGNGEAQSISTNNNQPAASPGNIGSQSGDPVVSIGSSALSMNADSAYLFGSQTLAPGGPALTFSGTTISLGLSGNNIINNGMTSPLVSPYTQPVITLGSLAVTPAASSAYLINGHTLVPGGPALTLSGSTLSLPSAGSNILLNGTPSPLSPPLTASILAIGSLTLTLAASSIYLINGHTLLPGGPALTLSGSTLSLLPSGKLILNGVPVSPPPPPVLITGPQGVGTRTLVPGELLTLGSDVLSLAPSGAAVVVVSGTATHTVGVGGYVASMFGVATGPGPPGGAATGTGGAITFFTGGAEGRGRGVEWVKGMLVAGVLGWWFCR
ncbi:hypothetical protein MMC13_001353 [Lambiella insularis]|nr:hypothetical protein [Lambiella insularis]